MRSHLSKADHNLKFGGYDPFVFFKYNKNSYSKMEEIDFENH
jgi:hypothetical protein